MAKFNEDSRVKIPALAHLCRLGYEYLPSITLDHLKQSAISIPPQALIQSLDTKLKPILEQQLLLKKQSQHLAHLRDWLLPMLMNGQVRVK